MFFVVCRRRGPQWDPSQPLEGQSGWQAHADFMDGLVADGFLVLGGPLADEHRVVHAIEAASEARGARDARARSLVRLAPGRDRVEPWTIRLDGRVV